MDEGEVTRGVIIARWTHPQAPDYDGINWIWDGPPDAINHNLFNVMERYLTTGETFEILSYLPEYGYPPDDFNVERYFRIEDTVEQVRKAHAWMREN